MPASRFTIRVLQVFTLAAFLLLWHVLTSTKTLDPFFFATPSGMLHRTWQDLATGAFWRDLGITLLEAVLAFAIGALSGVVFGFWFGRSQLAGAVFSPFITMLNAVPRVVLAPLFALWLGLGIWSKVALGVTIVYFIVFFNVCQGVREVSPDVLSNARMLGMNGRQLLRHVYLPSALSWVFSSLHTAVGFALVGAVVGEYLGASAGLGYRIAQAEGVFDTVGVFSGLLVLTLVVNLIDAAVSAVEGRLLVWHPRAASTVSERG